MEFVITVLIKNWQTFHKNDFIFASVNLYTMIRQDIGLSFVYYNFLIKKKSTRNCEFLFKNVMNTSST